MRETPSFRLQSLYTDPQNPTGGTAPPGVQQRHAARRCRRDTAANE